MVGQIEACKIPPEAVVVVVPDAKAQKKVMAQIEAADEDRFEKLEMKPQEDLIKGLSANKFCCAYKVTPNDVKAWIEVLEKALPVIILTKEAIWGLFREPKPKETTNSEDIKEAA